MPETTRRRALGSFYTPKWIARWMVSRALAAESLLPAGTLPDRMRILDPACGDGAFVLALLEWIAEQRRISPADIAARLQIVRTHLFGVDADLAAITTLRRRVADWIGSDPVHDAEITAVLAGNFPCGDALLGNDWLHSPDPSTESSSGSGFEGPDHGRAAAIDWSLVFPQVAADGGFDLVIGNPPYRRERDAKSDFDRVARSPLGQRWRTARMDFWHYFFHRGLDLLKPGGRLSLIVNSYWTGATAAARLRDRMSAETSLERLVLLGSARLFPDVAGRHMIFQLCKGRNPDRRCTVLDLSGQSRQEIEAAFAGGDIAGHTVSQGELWSEGRLRTDVAGGELLIPRGPSLDQSFEVRQGIAENPPYVTRLAARDLGDPLLAGRGLFVLTADEVAALQLTDEEQRLLRPYYALPAIDRFHVAPAPSHQILYLTRQTAPDLDRFPHVAAHLGRYRGVLQRRREARSGMIAWWHLHWPREERLFLAPRILCLQMGRQPRFAFAEQPTFVGFSMHVVVDRPAATGSPAGLSLAALTAILNSSHARRWFESHAKRRGAHLDISGAVLKQFPLPARPLPAVVTQLDTLARNWAASEDSETRLTMLVAEAYAGPTLDEQFPS